MSLSSHFSQVIVLFRFSRKSQNEKFLEFFQLFAVSIEIEKCRLFFAFLRLACLIDSCQEKAPNSNQNRFICSFERARTKHGPGVHGPLLWTGSMDPSPTLFFFQCERKTRKNKKHETRNAKLEINRTINTI